MDPARIAKIPLFAKLTIEQRDRIAAMCNELEVEEGATLLREGDFGYSMFAITAGAADVLQGGVVIQTLGPGDFFGEIAVLSGGRRTATVVARTKMQVVTVFNRDVWRLEHDAPEVGTALRARIAEHLEPAR